MTLVVDTITKRFGDIVALDGVCLLVGVALALWVAARIYSAGVLLYGQRAGLRAVWRAVRVNR